MPATILVADDHADMRRLLRLYLSNAGYDVVEAPDGVLGLQMLQLHKIDLVVCDKGMPDIDGIEFITAVRSSDGYKTLPVIVLSGYSNDRDMLQGIQAGANEWLTKPVSQSDLIAAINRQMVNEQ